SQGGPRRSRSECRRGRRRATVPGRRARRVGAHRAALLRSGNAPHPRRDPAEARPGQYLGGRAVFADRDRCRAVAKSAQLELRAALSLAKLYRAANRDADAHTVLAAAVEGFPPTQQFPELTEAQTL